ncbi:MAG: archaellin/type IV pilin N-terminal domain-containing protein [Desulfurococcaceae archaeon]|nr:hypothetical protein [Sulfolobales archaeon]MDW8169484.1 archaellin/type IV pilin N-terminal domain-containing protein [Desulfurococcaceae archaeon]
MARGIEPVIAAVILIAIAVVVAIAVIGWIMGLWGAVTTPREQLSVTGVSLTTTSGAVQLKLIVVNSGGALANITSVSINGPNCATTNTTYIEIGPGESREVTVIFTTNCILVTGSMYSVTVYTKAGGAYPTVVRAT